MSLSDALWPSFITRVLSLTLSFLVLFWSVSSFDSRNGGSEYTP